MSGDHIILSVPVYISYAYTEINVPRYERWAELVGENRVKMGLSLPQNVQTEKLAFCP